MPWTFSHPAVVFPLKHSRFGRGLNLPALVTGSLSPDLLYSFGLYRAAGDAHHFGGWFYTGLPFCLLLILIFHYLSEPLKKILPVPVTDPLTRSWRDNAVVLISLFIGAATHIIWDAFTHETGTVVRAVSLLQASVLQGMTDGQEIAVYKVLQHLGSLLGAGYLCLVYIRYQRRLDAAQQQENRRKFIRLAGLAVFSALCALPVTLWLAHRTNGFHVNRFVFYELSLTVPFLFGFIVLMALFYAVKRV